MKLLRKEKVKDAREVFVLNRIGIVLLTLMLVLLILIIVLVSTKINAINVETESIKDKAMVIDKDLENTKGELTGVDDQLISLKNFVNSNL